MRVDLVPHSRLRELPTTGPDAVFRRFVFDLAPDGSSLAALDGDAVVGMAVSGRPFKLHRVWPHWIAADNQQAACALAREIASGTACLSFPSQYSHAIARVLDDRKLTIDCLYLLESDASLPSSDKGLDPLWLDADTLERLELPGDMPMVVGSVLDWGVPSYLCGIVEDNRLVAVGETTVRDAEYVAVQQLYTLPSHRGRGCARSITRCLCAEALAGGRAVVYVVDEGNRPSRSVAESLGFQLHSKWGAA